MQSQVRVGNISLDFFRTWIAAASVENEVSPSSTEVPENKLFYLCALFFLTLPGHSLQTIYGNRGGRGAIAQKVYSHVVLCDLFCRVIVLKSEDAEEVTMFLTDLEAVEHLF